MDRLDAMNAFVATVDAGGLSAAARRLGCSVATISRAVSFVEASAGARLLHRTTRSMRLTAAGERYLGACRRILLAVKEAEGLAAQERAEPRGVLVVTAPAIFGRLHVRPIVDAFVGAHREVDVRLLLLDRVVNLVDEGVDVAIRIADLPDSSLVAVKVGEVQRVVCASPSYLASRRAPSVPKDLAGHACVSFSQVTPSDVWTFTGGRRGGRSKHVKTRPRITTNSADAAIGSALAGIGVTCVLSYQVEAELEDGSLVRLLPSFEPRPAPIHVVCPSSEMSAAKVRAFVDFAVRRLRGALSSRSARISSPE
jgi:DNA-binding transcriptional LysR family regulator